MRVPAAVLSLILLTALVACDEEVVADGVCTGSEDLGGEAGDICPGGPVDCRWGLACASGRCGSCDTTADCRDLEACLPDGSCGPCSESFQCAQGHTCRGGACLPEEVPSWELTVDDEDWQTLHESWWEDDYFPCTLTVGDTVYADGCEVRPYGSTSRVYPKKSLRIRFPEDGAHPGYSRKITLRAEYNDPTHMRTYLGYESFRRLSAIPTPRTRHVRLRVNGEVYGLMLEMERTGGKFLEAHGRDRDGSTYEAEHAPPHGALMPMPSAEEYAVFDDDVLYNKKTGDPDDYSDLIALIEDVLWLDYLDSGTSGPTSLERTAEAVDVDAQVTYLAVMALLQNRDHVAANYHISLQRDARFEPIWEVYPFDLDTTFGCVYDEVDQNNVCDELVHDVWWLNGMIPEGTQAGYPEPLWANLLIHLVLGHDECRARFDERLCAKLGGDYWTQRLPGLIDGLAETLRPAVDGDPNDLNEDVAEFDAAVEDLAAFVDDRADYLRSQLGCM